MIPKIANTEVYLERMAKPLAEKLKVVKFIPKGAKNVLDVGCSDGVLTAAMAEIFHDINFLGIDLDEEFIKIAQERYKHIPNLKFERVYLRELLPRPERYQAITFCSVLHEFYTYGEQISSVLKAVSDAHELVQKDGVIIIRDMVLSEYTKESTLRADTILEKINSSDFVLLYEEFKKINGDTVNIYSLNHFLLKYMYTENWDREKLEHYVPVTFEEYSELFKLLGMRLQFKDSYLIEYLKNKWQQDFGLTEDEIAALKSTALLVAQKV